MQDYLIVARCGRSLAESAKRAGFRTHVLDCFADEDTHQFADTVKQLQYLEEGFADKELTQSIRDVLSDYPDTEIVIGSGFEAAPQLIDQLGLLAPLYSNTSETIKTLKQPDAFFKLLDSYSIKYPKVTLNYPDKPEHYLIKKVASMGGEHIQWCHDGFKINTSNAYFQEYIDGTVSSTVFLADGQGSKIVGFNKQVQSKQFETMPFLFGGACTVQDVTRQHYAEIKRIINCIVEASGLKGLCGLDYILTKQGEIYVLEVNPRPPSTFELHETDSTLFKAHISCFEGDMEDVVLERYPAYRAYVILYAEHDIQIPIDFEWPVWVKDRPAAGTRIKKSHPVCTIHVEEDSLSNISKAIQSRRHQLEVRLGILKDAA